MLDGLVGANRIKWSAEFTEGLTARHVVFGRDVSNVGEVQIAVVVASQHPTRALLEPAWRDRGAGSAMPVIVAAQFGSEIWILGPSENSPIVGPLPVDRATTQLQAVLNEPDGVSARRLAQSIVDAHVTTGEVGFTNHFLFASHYLKNDVSKRPDWPAASELAQHLCGSRGRALIENLGFEVQPAVGDVPNILILRGSGGDRRAVAVLLDETEPFDQKSARFQISPVAHGLEVAGRENAPWVIVMRQSALRLYPGRDGVGVGQRGQSETYFELDLNLIDDRFAGLLPMIFSADALEDGGTADQILGDSGKYAAELGTRLRDRVYKLVVPEIALAIANRLPGLGVPLDANGLNVAYSLTLRVLFRLIFQAYGEDTGLLPAGRNAGYDSNSLQAFIKRDLNADPREYSELARTIWLDLTQVWDAVYNGNSRWNVPAYGGSLFDPTSIEGRLLTEIQLPDSVVGPALQNLLSEQTEDGFRGSVDFRSLQVREFGTIYEGLLESSLSIAETNLALDENDTFVPATDSNYVVAQGEPYFHSASGDRRATGSYYTPKFVVDHLIEQSVEGALGRHLENVKIMVDRGDERSAAKEFWNFRVADLAMGSAHFLVAAVDKIERGMRDFLTNTPIPLVRSELERLSQKAREQLGHDIEAADGINEAQLLRRQVARRCIYGLDINPLAVELSRLAIWVHTFVPGLPMSSLDHNLILGDSITGIATIDEAVQALGIGDLLAPLITKPLNSAKNILADIASASEADRSEVLKGAQLAAEARATSSGAKSIFDVAFATRIGAIPPGSAMSDEEFTTIAASEEVRVALEGLNPAHLPLCFPEVFLRENPGFDVILGNPPWEKIQVDELEWWSMRFPGLRALSQTKRDQKLDELRAQNSALKMDFEKLRAQVERLRRAVMSGPYPGLGKSNPDLYQAFMWRNWQLIRDNGCFAAVSPRSAFNGQALANLRLQILDHGSIEHLVFLKNDKRWIFDISEQITVALGVIRKFSQVRTVSFCGPLRNRDELENSQSAKVTIQSDDLLRISPIAAIPTCVDQDSIDILLKLYGQTTLVSQEFDSSYTLQQGDLNAASDKGLFARNQIDSEQYVPVLTGASFNLWNPNAGEPYAHIERLRAREFHGNRISRALGNRGSAYFGANIQSPRLPMDFARVVFRPMARATDSRTMIASLIAPGQLITNKAQLIINKEFDPNLDAFVLGVISSIPYDWAIRCWVETTVTLEIVAQSPFPHQHLNGALGKKLIANTAQLAAVDSRFSDWAGGFEISAGDPRSADEKQSLIEENDALVAMMYRLEEHQLIHVFETFSRTVDYRDRMTRVLEKYKRLKEEF